MTNPNCEYSFNIPVLYTMGSWYQSHVNSCGEWDSMQASKEAIPHFLAEMKRKTGSFTLDDLPKLNPEVRKFLNPFAWDLIDSGNAN